MAGINKVILIGNLGRDPEIRATQSGDRCANLSLATSETWRDKASGERKEKTEWHRVVVWNEHLVKIIEDLNIKKGAKLYVEGALATRKWTDRDGVERYNTEIVLGRFNGQLQILGGRDKPDAEDRAPAGTAVAAQRPLSQDLDDEIPF